MDYKAMVQFNEFCKAFTKGMTQEQKQSYHNNVMSVKVIKTTKGN